MILTFLLCMYIYLLKINYYNSLSLPRIYLIYFSLSLSLSLAPPPPFLLLLTSENDGRVSSLLLIISK